MSRKLLIVESPAKAKTINKYLGNDFIVIASYGHVRDLPKKKGSIDIENEFKPDYQIVARNKKYVDEIIAQSKLCDQIYLATDPDREGEAIAWHISEILKSKREFKNKQIERVTFNEITEGAIKEAIKDARKLDLDLVNAQQARLTLDYLIGFNVSPLLWDKIKYGLSAGRVQSPALRLICEREEEIKSFVSEDYFSVFMYSNKNSITIKAKLIEHDGQKIEQKTIKDEAIVVDICNELGKFKVTQVLNITKKQKKRNPLPPFITSTIQIESARKLGFNTDKTMKTAQLLYEGIDIGSETVGLITYMRTDSVNLSQLALSEIREFIKENYDSRYLPNKPVQFVNKVKNAQEAHEAIRPTSIFRTPNSVKKYLTTDQYKLYELIWLRTLSSQFSAAILDTTAIDFKLNNSIFRVNGVVVNFDGFMKVYQEAAAEDKTNDGDEEDGDVRLPEVVVGEDLPVEKVDFYKHQTEPKPRYSEASLVKSLEELGIGRPSTYASIISTLKKREYVLMEKKRFIPTDIGMVVNKFLTNHISRYVDFKFTANMEDTLDDISNGKIKKLPVLEGFWTDLQNTITEKKNIARADLIAEKLDESCPLCNKQLMVKFGKYGKFIGCSGYPECNYMSKVDKDGNKVQNSEPLKLEVVEGRVCPKDGGILVIREGKYGKFISCKNYPKCKHIESLDKTATDDESVECPECKTGHIVTKKNRYGNWFYACNNYPDCKTLFNHRPLAEKCPQCGYGILLYKVTKSSGEQKVCAKCDFKENIFTEANKI